MSALPIPGPPSFYVVGGTMRPDALSYVCRDADEELYAGLSANEFCHVLTARQMGKSSLMLRTCARLRAAGIEVAILDLTGIGTNLSPEQWYSGLIVQLGTRLNLEDELLEFWRGNEFLGPMQRWVRALRQVVLPLRRGRLAIFIDEIDAVLSLNFSTDEFFAGIRECYNLRNEDAEMNRLTFCLLGVVNPADLIRDTRTTPFNVGRRIELNDFTEAEAAPLARGLGRNEAENHTLLKRIFHWTNGHPYLTQRLCKVVSEHRTGSNHDIDEAIEQMFFCKRAQAYDDNLIFVRERMLRSGVDVAALLNLYAHVRRGKTVADDDSQSLVSILRLSGITRNQNGRLRVRNRIYMRVFDAEWIKANLPGAEIRRQRAAFRRGVIRTTVVAAVILSAMTALAIIAFHQRNLAREQTAVNNKLLYMARMKLANQETESANMARVEELVNETAPQPGEADLRGFEWFLFWRYANAATMRLKVTGHIASARFLKGNETIAVAEVIHTMTQHKREYSIKFFDRKSQQQTGSFSVPAGTNFDIAAFSPDGRYVATDAPDRSVAVWDLSSGNLAHELPGAGTSVLSVTFAPDQKTIAGSFIYGRLKVWDLDSNAVKFEDQSKLDRPGTAFSPDGKLFAVGMDEDRIDLLDANTWTPARSVPLTSGAPGLIFFSPDGDRLLFTTADGRLNSWNMRDGQLVNFSEVHNSEILSFSFSPDGKTLATGSVDRTIKLWDVATGRQLRTIRGHGGYVAALHWSTDGQYLLSGDNNGLLKMWDLGIRDLPLWPSQSAESVSATKFTPENELIALGRTNGRLKLWNLSQGKIVADLDSVQMISSGCFSKDASLVAAAMGLQIRIYSVFTGKMVSALTVPTIEVYSLQFSPDGTKLLSADRAGNVILFDVFSRREERRFDSGNMYYRAVLSPDGKQLASADQDGKIRIWNVASQSITKTLTGHTAVAKLLSFSPNGRMLASAGQDDTVRLWDLESLTELRPPLESQNIQRMAFTPDGKRLVTVDIRGDVVLWDVPDMQEVVTLRRGDGEPTSVSLSDDGLILAVSSEAGAVTVWQAGKPGF